MTEAMHFVVTYRDPSSSEIVELKARNINDSPLGITFISISEFVFDVGGKLVNPTLESLASRFENVRTLHLPIYNVLSIEEVGEKTLELSQDRSNLVVLPRDPGSSKG